MCAKAKQQVVTKRQELDRTGQIEILARATFLAFRRLAAELPSLEAQLAEARQRKDRPAVAPCRQVLVPGVRLLDLLGLFLVSWRFGCHQEEADAAKLQQECQTELPRLFTNRPSKSTRKER